MNIAVTGATGNMGRVVLTAARNRPEITVALAVNRDPSSDRVAGVRVRPAQELADLLREYHPDAVVDFTGPESAVEYAHHAVENGIPFVSGTTGLSSAQENQLRELSRDVPILYSPNFSPGIHVLLATLRDAASMLPSYDIEILETHHNQKRDAPSGTAHRLLEQVESVRGDAPIVYGREGNQPRKTGEIGVHARRAGNIRGEHEVLFAGNDEVVQFTHRAESRQVYAEGALDAAVWIAGQPPGWYEFTDTFES